MPKCSMGTNNRRVGWASLWAAAIWTPARANAGAGSLAAEKCHRRVDDIECSWTQITRQVSPCILHFTYTASCIFVRYTCLCITCSRCKCHLTYCILHICIKHIFLSRCTHSSGGNKHVSGFSQTCVENAKHLQTYNCVVFVTHVCLFPNTFVKIQTCVEKSTQV